VRLRASSSRSSDRQVFPRSIRLSLSSRRRGSAVAPAVATAARGEMAGESRQISYHDLRALGYIGLSDIFAFRSATVTIPA